MIALGIDPGTALCGYGLVRAVEDEMELVTYGAIATPANTALSIRLKKIYAELMALLAAAQADLPLYEYTPNEVKQAVVGYGSADKNQVQQMVRMLLHLDHVPEPDDAADAVAIAICHLQGARLRELIDSQDR